VENLDGEKRRMRLANSSSGKTLEPETTRMKRRFDSQRKHDPQESREGWRENAADRQGPGRGRLPDLQSRMCGVRGGFLGTCEEMGGAERPEK